MLGVGIGLMTATFTIADSLLFKAVPFRDAEQLAQLVLANERGGPNAVPTSVYEAWRELSVFDAVEAANAETVLIDTDAGPIERRGALVSSGLFEMLGIRPVRGRLFEPGEGRPGTADVVLISEGLWRSVYGADAEIIGRRNQYRRYLRVRGRRPTRRLSLPGRKLAPVATDRLRFATARTSFHVADGVCSIRGGRPST